MTISPRVSSVLRCLLVVALTVTAYVANQEASHWVVVLSLSALATMAVMRTPNVLLHWPIGLLAVIGATYGQYIWQWITGPTGVTTDSASTTFRVLIGLFGVIALARSAVIRESLQLPTPLRVIAVAVMVALPAVLLVLVTTRWFDDPVRIISGHLGGGDHGPHNKIVHGLLQESGQVSFVSPFQMYSYPQSLHFFIANLVALTRSVSNLPLLAQEYAMGAWFEWLQFAAFCQLAVVIFMSKAKSQIRFLFIPVLAFVFASMDNFVVQMLWSGFTTSIGITWLLLAFVVVADRALPNTNKWSLFSSTAALLGFAAMSWTIYQPYAAIFVFLFFLLVVQQIEPRIKKPIGVRITQVLLNNSLAQLVIVIGGTILFLLVVLGPSSPAVTSLSLDGSTFKPYLYTVLLWAFLAIVINQYIDGAELRPNKGVGNFLITHFGFVVAFAVTVVFTSDYGFLTLPYYPQKMLWTLLFISIPIALSRGFTVLEEWLSSKQTLLKVRVITVVWLFLVLVPLVQGRAPTNATKHVTVGWFAEGMVLPIDHAEVSAFSMRDLLGSHMANLALQSVSKNYLEPDIAISGNPYLACKYIENKDASTVFTTPNGRAELVESGCRPDRLYVENAQKIASPRLEYFGVRAGVVERFQKGQLGFRLLLRGFLPPERWGIWAGGYRSAIGFKYEQTLRSPELELVLRPNPKDEVIRTVVISANNKIIGRQILRNKDFENYKFNLPPGEKDTSIELTITCERDDDVILADDAVDGPNPCVGLQSMRISN
jgi:hypothetical protein